MSFVKGAVVGVLVGGAGLATLSLIAPQPAGLAPPASPLQDAPSSAPPDAGAADATPTPAPQAFGEAPSSSETRLPAPVPADATPDPVTTSADRPAPATEADTLGAPATGSAGTPEIDADAPVLPNPQSRAPDASAPDRSASVDQTPPAPLLVDTPDEPSGGPITVVIEEDASTDSSDESAGDGGSQAAAEATTEAPRATEDTLTDGSAPAAGATDDGRQPTAGETVARAETTEPATDTAPASREDPPSSDDAAVQPQAGAGGGAFAAEGDNTQVAGTVVDGGSGDAEGGAASRLASTDADADDGGAGDGSNGPSGTGDPGDVAPADTSDSATDPSGEQSSGGSDSAADSSDGAPAEGTVTEEGVTIAVAPARTVRPPSRQTEPETEDAASTGRGGVIVTRAGETSPPPGTPDASDAGAGASQPPGTPRAPDAAVDALATYSAFSDPGDGRPQMSLVLIDDGSLPDPARLLTELDLPVTVAIDPDLTDAGARMETYRALGFEVAALARLPRGGTGSDAAVALEGTFSVLPEAVALVVPDSGVLRPSGEMTAEVADTLSRDGRGLVIAQTGFGGTIAAASAQGVPALPVYRDLRTIDQSERTIRRFLDQAAFRAGQEESLVLLATLSPDLLSALGEWGGMMRRGRVALTPVSSQMIDTK